MTRVAIIAAIPGELKPLVRDWLHERRHGVELWRWRFGDQFGDQSECVAACAGAGVEAATRAFAEIEKDGPVSAVISTGWAGALSEGFVPGTAYWVSGVVDARTGERFETDSVGIRLPRSQKRDLHPTDEDLSVGTRTWGTRRRSLLGAGSPRLKIESRGAWSLWTPTLATKTRTSRGWGTQFRANPGHLAGDQPESCRCDGKAASCGCLQGRFGGYGGLRGCAAGGDARHSI